MGSNISTSTHSAIYTDTYKLGHIFKGDLIVTMIFLSKSPGKRQKRISCKKNVTTCTVKNIIFYTKDPFAHRFQSQTQNIIVGYLMMLAAAFLSWVSNSGSCITSSRKAITFVFSSLLVSKS